MLLGVQKPRLFSAPVGDVERGIQAVEFCRWVGMTLFPWQEDLLRDLCRTTPTPRSWVWSHRESVVVLARQNGKGEVLVARELVGVFLFGEKDLLHTAHFMDTAIDARDRLWEVIEGNEDLLHWWDDDPVLVGKIPTLVKNNGKEAIHFPNGAKIKFRTRTKKTGRGLSCELVVFDECFDLPNEVHAAISKLTRAQERAQTIYISSPVNRFEHAHGAIFSAKRWAGIDGAEGMLFREWSPAENDDPFVQETWAKCNPSLVDEGPGAQLSDIRADAMAAKNSDELLEQFLVESLGKGNWYPRSGELAEEFTVIGLDAWQKAYDPGPNQSGESCIAVDVAPGAATASAVSAIRCGGRVHLLAAPITDFDRDEIAEFIGVAVDASDPCGVFLDPAGAASTLVHPLEAKGVDATSMTAKTVSAAFELFMRMFEEGRISHDGDERWVEAWRIAKTRTIREIGRALTRAEGDISLIVAATFAVWGLVDFENPGFVEPKMLAKKRFVGKAAAVSSGVPEAHSMPTGRVDALVF